MFVEKKDVQAVDLNVALIQPRLEMVFLQIKIPSFSWALVILWFNDNNPLCPYELTYKLD